MNFVSWYPFTNCMATAHSRPSTAESPRFEPFSHTLLMLRRLHDNDPQDPAFAHLLPDSGPPRSRSGESVRLPDPFRLMRQEHSAARVCNHLDGSIRQRRPASAYLRFLKPRTA